MLEHLGRILWLKQQGAAQIVERAQFEEILNRALRNLQSVGSALKRDTDDGYLTGGTEHIVCGLSPIVGIEGIDDMSKRRITELVQAIERLRAGVYGITFGIDHWSVLKQELSCSLKHRAFHPFDIDLDKRWRTGEPQAIEGDRWDLDDRSIYLASFDISLLLDCCAAKTVRRGNVDCAKLNDSRRG